MTIPDDLVAAIQSEPVGSLKLFRATEADPDVELAIKNRAEIAVRVAHARSCGCTIEVLSLRLQYMDIWLRIFYENVPHTDSRQQEFGRLLKQCLKLGLDNKLYERLHKFNKQRVDAIHGWLIGKTHYESLTDAVLESDGLSEELAEFVLLNCGEVVTEAFLSKHHNRGDRVIHLPSSIAHLRGRQPI